MGKWGKFRKKNLKPVTDTVKEAAKAAEQRVRAERDRLLKKAAEEAVAAQMLAEQQAREEFLKQQAAERLAKEKHEAAHDADVVTKVAAAAPAHVSDSTISKADVAASAPLASDAVAVAMPVATPAPAPAHISLDALEEGYMWFNWNGSLFSASIATALSVIESSSMPGDTQVACHLSGGMKFQGGLVDAQNMLQLMGVIVPDTNLSAAALHLENPEEVGEVRISDADEAAKKPITMDTEVVRDGNNYTIRELLHAAFISAGNIEFKIGGVAFKGNEVKLRQQIAEYNAEIGVLSPGMDTVIVENNGDVTTLTGDSIHVGYGDDC